MKNLEFRFDSFLILFVFYMMVATLSLQASPVAHWQMDELAWDGTSGEVVDSVGGHHGTAQNGASTTEAKVCRGGWFRGEGYNGPPNNQWYQARYYVEVPHSDSLSPQASGNNAQMTISGWFNPRVLGGTQTIVHKGGSNNWFQSENHEYRAYLNNNRLSFDLWNRWGGSQTFTISHNLSADTWYFFAFTMSRRGNSDRVDVKGYLYSDTQNSPIATYSSGNVNLPLSGLTTNRNLNIGATNWGGIFSPNNHTNFFDGLIDEIRIDDSELSESQIRDLKNVQRSCGGALPILDYHMDECSWDGTVGEVEDSSDNNLHATAIHSDASSLQEGIMNNAGAFTRSNSQYVQLPTLGTNKINFNDGFAITTWAKFSATSGNWERIFDFGNGADQNNIFMGREGTSNTLIFGIHESTTGDNYLRANGAISDTNWHFFALSCSGSTCSLYKDGTQIASSNSMKIPSHVNRTSNYIGKSNWNDAYFEGGVDEFKVFDQHLGVAQIQSIYLNELEKKNYDGTERLIVDCVDFSSNNVREFSQLGNWNLNGDMKIIGNTVMVQNGGNCPANDARNNSINAVYVNIDPDNGNNFNSSSAQLALPSGYRVKKAYLFWQGYLPSLDDSIAKVRIKSPSGSYHEIVSESSKLNWVRFSSSRFMYQGMSDITQIVSLGGLGDYTVANIHTREGKPAGGSFGGWSIVVVYEDDEATLKNVSVFDGYQAISSNDASQPDVFTSKSIPISGFMTPLSGDVNSKFFLFAGEGDLGAAGDTVSLQDKDGNSINVSGSLNPVNDIMNSTITENDSYVTSRNPNCQNTIGIDIDTFDVGNTPDALGIIGNDQTSTTVRFVSSGDGYFPGVMAFSTELYIPDVCYEEYITKDGAPATSISLGDLLDIEVYITNKNFEPAKGVSIRRFFNDENEYERNSTQIFEAGSFESMTDTSGDDLALYDENENLLHLNLGEGATWESGGIISLDQNETFLFQFRPFVDGNISSSYLVSYRDESGVSGEVREYSNIPIGKCSNRNITETIISVDPSGNARIVESGKNWNDFNGGLFTKVVGLGTTYDILFATDDSGATLSSGEITKIELVDIYQGSNSVVETLHDGSMIVNQRATFAYTFGRAYRRVQFRLTLASGDTAFSNDFSVRPAEFNTTPLSLRAREAYTLPEGSLKATSYGSVSPASGYTRLLQVNHIDELLFDNTKICQNNTKDSLVGNINIEVTDGSSQATSVVSFRDIGEFDLVLLDEGWIQSDDKQLSHCITDSTANALDAVGRVGCGVGGSLHVSSQPFDLNVTNVTIIPSNDFRYIDSSLTQNVTITFDVHALKFDGAIAQNFDLQCYQTPVQIDDINFTINTDAPQQRVVYTFNGAPSNQASYTLAPNAPLFDFALGASQNNQFVYNFERSVSNPVNPLHVDSFSASFSSGFATTSLNQDVNTSFVYGRIRPLDTITVSNSVQTPVEIEVFNSGASDFTDGMFEQSLDWYRNGSHTNVAFGRILSGLASQPQGLLPMVSDNVTVTPGAITSGIQDLDLSTTQPAPLQRTIHLQISPWLWFSTEGVDYNASVGSTCKTHPCLDFIYDDFTGREAIKSGDFRGLNFEVDDLDANSSAERKRGVKVFR